MLEERLNSQLILSVNNDITELLTYEKAIKECAARNVGRQACLGNSPPICEMRTLRAGVVALCPHHLGNRPELEAESPAPLHKAPAPDLAEHVGHDSGSE